MSLNGIQYKPGRMRFLKNYGHSMKWKEQGENRRLSVSAKKRVNSCLMIDTLKAQKAVEMYLMTVIHQNQGKNFIQETALWV